MHGQLRSEIICPEPDCGNVSIKFDPFLMHTLELHKSLDMARKSLNTASSDNMTIYDCLDQDKAGTRLEEGNEWYCSQCKNRVLATKKLELYRLPKILVFHFKRFNSTDKITKTIDFPLEGLDLSRYYRGTEGAIYDCYAVSNHFGS